MQVQVSVRSSNLDNKGTILVTNVFRKEKLLSLEVSLRTYFLGEIVTGRSIFVSYGFGKVLWKGPASQAEES